MMILSSSGAARAPATISAVINIAATVRIHVLVTTSPVRCWVYYSNGPQDSPSALAATGRNVIAHTRRTIHVRPHRTESEEPGRERALLREGARSVGARARVA